MFGLLIVEDEPLVRQGLLTLINYEQFGISPVLEAADGRQAWALFEKNPVHCFDGYQYAPYGWDCLGSGY